MEYLEKHEKKALKKDIENLIDEAVIKPDGLDFVQVSFEDEKFQLIGCGCSSAVFRSKQFPFVAVKIYSREFREQLFNEVMAYKKIKGLKWFPRLFFYGKGYLAIDYIEGKSLYEHLIEGLEIKEDILQQVDEAIEAAKNRGLKPSDVHFKNVLVSDGRVMLVDLSDYLTAVYVNRWSRQKFFYRTIYKPFFRKVKIPKKVVDFFRKNFKIIENFIDFIVRRFNIIKFF
jgi:predicted Ser/Thr protein kinase